jgi:hypothetical protein
MKTIKRIYVWLMCLLLAVNLSMFGCASANGAHYTSAFEEATVFGTSTLGGMSLAAASTVFEWEQAVTSGDTLLVAFCAANSLSSHPMGWALEVKSGGTWTSGLASGALGASAATQLSWSYQPARWEEPYSVLAFVAQLRGNAKDLEYFLVTHNDLQAMRLAA